MLQFQEFERLHTEHGIAIVNQFEKSGGYTIASSIGIFKVSK